VTRSAAPPKYRDRSGEVLGHSTVLNRHRKDRQNRWIHIVRDHKHGRDRYMKSYELSRIAKSIECGTEFSG
jgi:hypothetical protein